ncbi:MAG: hypothetical protein RL181_283 [Bacteroidota bacterium]|jgi:hypothetical protein
MGLEKESILLNLSGTKPVQRAGLVLERLKKILLPFLGIGNRTKHYKTGQN